MIGRKVVNQCSNKGYGSIPNNCQLFITRVFAARVDVISGYCYYRINKLLYQLITY